MKIRANIRLDVFCFFVFFFVFFNSLLDSFLPSFLGLAAFFNSNSNEVDYWCFSWDYYFSTSREMKKEGVFHLPPFNGRVKRYLQTKSHPTFSRLK